MKKQFQVLAFLALAIMVGCESVPTDLAEDTAPLLKKGGGGGGKPGGGGGGGGPANPVIAFSVNSELRVINADGSNSTVVVPDEQFYTSPAWSPLGDGMTIPFQIVYSSDLCGPLATVNITVIDGVVVASAPTIIEATRDEELSCSSSPAWSPDGNRIAFHANSSVTCSENGNDVTQFTYNLFTMNPDGSDRTRHTHTCDDTRPWSPSWSPDGNAIAFRNSGTGGEAIKILHLGDNSIVTVFDKAEIPELRELRHSPDWGRDDNNPKLAFTAVRSNSKGNRNRAGVYTVDLQKDASGHYSVREPGMAVLEVDGRRPSWAPDDTRFVMDGLTIYDVTTGEETSRLGRGGAMADWRR